MTTNPKSKKDWKPETFPEPRTVPEGWHGAALEEKKKNAKDQETPPDDWKPETFPKPRMFPWDSNR